jgi:GldM C-terminal domain
MRLFCMKLFFICVLTIFSIAANGQISISNLSLTDSTLPYFYIGVDNEIKIDWKKFKPAKCRISITGGDGSLFVSEEKKYIIRVKKVTDDCGISISNKKRKTLFKKTYKVRYLKDCYISLGGLPENSDRKQTKRDILATPFLLRYCPDSIYHYTPKFEVVSFEISVDIKDSVVTEPAKGNYLSEKQIELIKHANEDGILTIDNIRVKGTDGRSVKLPSIVIYIKKEEQ